MGDRGSVKAYHAAWTEPDPENPGKRRKRFAATWTFRFEYHKKRYLGGENYQTKREALDAGEKRKAEVVRGMESDPSRTTFAVLDRLLTAEATNQKTGTAHSTLMCLARLRKVFKADERLQDLRRTRILEALGQYRAMGLQDSTIKLTLGHLKHAMSMAQDEGLMFMVPKFPKIEVRPRQETVQPHDLEAIIKKLKPHWLRYYLIADELGWRAGSEIRSRQWTDVDFGSPGWVHLDAEHCKTGKPRSFPMTERLRALLTEQRAWIEALQISLGKVIPTVFAQPNGKPLPNPQKAWAAASKRAGYGKLNGRTGPWSSAKVPHDIRRAVLRRWKAAGEQLDVRMELAGHETTETHEWYTGGDLASLQAWAKRMDEARKEQAAKVMAITRG